MYIKTRTKTYNINEQALVMGILNTTPDSFSDGGNYNSVEKAIDHALEMEADGAHIIDVGGESTRPNHQTISETEEIERVVPIIKELKDRLSIPISIDTYKANVAEAAIQAGAEMINDIWGAKQEPKIAQIAAEYNVPIILMHNRTNKQYNSMIEDMITDLKESIEIAQTAGVKKDKIILDPGVGFGKELPDNFHVLHHLDTIADEFSYPMLLGTSSKSFISTILDITLEERDNATGATTCYGMMKGVRIFRVHDVARHVQLIHMIEAMMKGYYTWIKLYLKECNFMVIMV